MVARVPLKGRPSTRPVGGVVRAADAGGAAGVTVGVVDRDVADVAPFLGVHVSAIDRAAVAGAVEDDGAVGGGAVAPINAGAEGALGRVGPQPHVVRVHEG